MSWSARVVQMIVDTDHDVQGVLFNRRRHDHLAHAALEIRPQSFRGAKLSRALQNQIDARIVPSHRAWLAAVAEHDAPSIDDERVILRAYRRVPAAVNAVELEQMSGGFGPALDFVYVDDRKRRKFRKFRKFRTIEGGAQCETADASEAIDSDPYGHVHAFACFTPLRRFAVGEHAPGLTASVAQAAAPKPAGAQISGRPPQQFSVR